MLQPLRNHLMKIHRSLLLLVLFTAFSALGLAQASPLLKRTIYKTDKLDFGSGGTLSVIGAPTGSIRIEGWTNNEIEISATIEVQAANEADLAKLSSVTGFGLEESMGRTGVVTLGPHEKRTAKQLGKKVSKAFALLPFRVDYVIKVPRYCDLQIDGGRGDFSVSGVEGTHKVNFLESDAVFALTGGSVLATIGKGTVKVGVPSRGWRGRFADFQLANGTMDVRLPAGLNAELDAVILRNGTIENLLADLKPRTRKAVFTDRSIIARAGAGGVPLKFTVGDGTLKLSVFDGRD